MIYTLDELIEKLKTLDEVTLLEVLDISSEEIVERFSDYVEDRQDILSTKVED